MQLKIVNPSQAIIESISDEELTKLTKQLSYINTAVQNDIKRLYNNRWFRSKNKEAWQAQIDELKKQVHQTLIFEENGESFIRSGSIPYLKDIDIELKNEIVYPIPKKVPWNKPIPFTFHPYQENSWKNLITSIHGNIELCTGAGKTAIILKACRETGLRTAVIAPSKSIFLELLDKFEHHFGKALVGTFGDGKKKLGKLFTICISDSLANIKPGTDEWEFFSQLDMFCVDESHTWGADSLEDVCHGLLYRVPYRMFFSGTQTRGDGCERLLQSIIGKTVCKLTTQEAKEKGYISDHNYKIIEIESSNPNYQTQDVIDMKREHFLRNRNVAVFIAKLANAEATTYRRQTLVLVEELSQIAALLPLLRVPTTVAHSEKGADRLEYLGIPKCNPKESVENFNKGEAMVLIGTSCVSTGTNIYPVHNCVNWQGGQSEIKTKQGAIGRSVRLGSQNPHKDQCTLKTKATIWDFNIKGIFTMERHLNSRIEYYKDSGSEIKYFKL